MSAALAIPSGAVPAMRLAATNLLEAKRNFIAVLSTGGAIEWEKENVGQIGELLRGTRDLHTRATAIVDASTPTSSDLPS